MRSHHFEKIEFYITNVCNLTCEGCNRFNNYNFKGWQRWSDYETLYRRWGELISIDHPVILGGEPLLNPTICDWVRGLHDIWQNPVQILSNGTRLDKTSGLYELLQTVTCSITISWHNAYSIERLEAQVNCFLKGEVTRHHKSDPGNAMNADIWWTDTNGVAVWVWITDHFNPSAIVVKDDGTLTLHDSPIDQAHDVCSFMQHKSYHMIKGKIYKCGPVALLPEFDQQHTFDLSPQDRELLNGYRPLTVDEYEIDHRDFFHNLSRPIAQCKFCPTNGDARPFVSREKKSMLWQT